MIFGMKYDFFTKKFSCVPLSPYTPFNPEFDILLSY